MRQTAINMVYDLAISDPRVVFIGSDLGPGVLANMKEEMPDRFFMEGVSEQAIISMAAGMAMEGFVPYVNTIATFLTRRCYEQLAVDLCLHDLPGRLIANGGGLVYAPLGPTHIAIEDIAILRALPNMTVCAVCDADEMARLMQASLNWPHPLYIRLAKGGDPIVSSSDAGFEIGRSILMRPPGQVLFVSTGVMTNRGLEAARLLEERGISSGLLHVHTIKPLDVDGIRQAAKNVDLVVTLEEGIRSGGLGSAVLEEALADNMKAAAPVMRLGLADAFPHGYGGQDHLLDLAGLQPAPIADRVRQAVAAPVDA